MSDEHLTHDDVPNGIFSKEQFEEVNITINHIIGLCLSGNANNTDFGFSKDIIYSELRKTDDRCKLTNTIKEYMESKADIDSVLGFTRYDCVNILTFCVFYNLWSRVIDDYVELYLEAERKKGYVPYSSYVFTVANTVNMVICSIDEAIRNSVEKFIGHMSSYAVFTAESALQSVCTSCTEMDDFTDGIYDYVTGIIGMQIRQHSQVVHVGDSDIGLSDIIKIIKEKLTVDNIVNDVASTEYSIRLPRTYAKSRSVIPLKVFVQGDDGVFDDDSIIVKAFKK